MVNSTSLEITVITNYFRWIMLFRKRLGTHEALWWDLFHSTWNRVDFQRI
jgi:hypothetical protein